MLFSEVDKHCRNECPPGMERILFTFCAKAFIVVNSFNSRGPEWHQKYKFELGCKRRNLTKPQTRGDNIFALVQTKLIREIVHKSHSPKWAS